MSRTIILRFLKIQMVIMYRHIPWTSELEDFCFYFAGGNRCGNQDHQLRMKNENRGIWKNQLCYLADDGDNALHAKQAETVCVKCVPRKSTYQINKIYLDAYQQIINASGETYPVAAPSSITC